MKKKSSITILLLFVILLGFSQTKPINSLVNNDPLDISSQLKEIEKYGIPTFESVEILKLKADSLYTNSMWKEAIIAYKAYSEKANWLANLVSQCLEPYYSASYDDKKSIFSATLEELIPYEAAANNLKKERNRAILNIGLCYKNLGDNKNAVSYLYQALDLISVDERTEWRIARAALSELILYKNDKK